MLSGEDEENRGKENPKTRKKDASGKKNKPKIACKWNKRTAMWTSHGQNQNHQLKNLFDEKYHT